MRKLNYDKTETYLTKWIGKYFAGTNCKTAIIGISGGIDSAVVAVLAGNALGRENVLGITMPSQNTSQKTLQYANLLAQTFDIKLLTVTIKEQYDVFANIVDILIPPVSPVNDIVLQNIQARVRGVILMEAANIHQALVLATGNRSENETGYCTLYGDTVGAFEIIGDLYKTEVWNLARYLHIPDEIIDQVPSAELAPGQTDEHDLLPYPLLDELLSMHEAGRKAKAITTKLELDQSDVDRIIAMGVRNAFKRLQTAPTVRLSKGCIL